MRHAEDAPWSLMHSLRCPHAVLPEAAHFSFLGSMMTVMLGPAACRYHGARVAERVLALSPFRRAGTLAALTSKLLRKVGIEDGV